MILNGNQRGGAYDLACHLMKDENEHVEVSEVRGFVSGTLLGALKEAEAISHGTYCRQFLYSLSLSPPETEHVPPAAFKDAIERVETKLGLTGHPRVVVFHEKEGRRHAHCVWSRIDTRTMKAVRMSHDRLKLGDISRELYLQHGWTMPEGLIDPALRNPLNFDRQEWFQAQRAGKDPRDIKAAFKQCWAASDSGKAFRQALEQRGYYLARGDRRDVVAIDVHGQIYAVARWLEVRTKDVNARMGDPDALPAVADVRRHVAGLVRDKLTGFAGSVWEEFARVAQSLEGRRISMVERHRTERRALQNAHNERRTNELKIRLARFRKGLLGVWDRITGQHARLREQNEREASATIERHAREAQALVELQLKERQELKREVQEARRAHTHEATLLYRQIAERRRQLEGEVSREDKADTLSEERRRRRGRTFILS